MIVADVNVIVYLLIEESPTEQARDLYGRDPDWIFPALWKHEFLNVLSSLVRTGRANKKDALDLWRKASRLFKNKEKEVDYDEVISISVDNNISAYDAQYVVLAMHYSVPLVTEDKHLLGKFPDQAYSLKDYTSSPS